MLSDIIMAIKTSWSEFIYSKVRWWQILVVSPFLDVVFKVSDICRWMDGWMDTFHPSIHLTISLQVAQTIHPVTSECPIHSRLGILKCLDDLMDGLGDLKWIYLYIYIYSEAPGKNEVLSLVSMIFFWMK